jgi:hypothetical protein
MGPSIDIKMEGNVEIILLNVWGDNSGDGEIVQDGYYILFLRAKTEDGIDIDITMPIDFIHGQKYVIKTDE